MTAMQKEFKGYARFFEETNEAEITDNSQVLRQVSLTTPKLESQAKEESEKFGVEPYRFVVLGLYGLSAIVGATLVNSFSPIVKTMESAFGASTWEIYLLTNMYLYSGAILNFPLLFLLQKIGNKNSLTIGLALMAIGTSLKLLMSYSIGWAIAGQAISVIGYEFLHPIIGAINCYWFPPTSRVIVFAFSNVAYSFGGLFGFLVPTLFVSDKNLSIESNRLEVYHLQIFFISVSFLVLIVHLIFFKEKPKIPLSQASLISRYDFFPSIKALLNNRNFLFVMLGMALLISVQFARYNNFFYLTRPFGFNQKEAGFLASIESWGEIFGLVVIMFASVKVERPKRILNWVPLGICLLFALTIGVYTFHSFLASAFVAFSLGAFFNAFPPLCENYSVAVTFPVPENIAVGTIFTGGLWGAWANGAIATSIRDAYGDEVFVWVIYPYFFALIIIAGIVFVFMKDVNLREEHEKGK
jgi:MFS family permease